MDNKEKILKGAHELFYKYGVKSVRMEDISKHLSISKKTLYQFFSNKAEIVDSFVLEKLEKNKFELEEIRKSSLDPIMEIIGMMSYMKTSFSNANPILYYDIQKYHPGAWLKFKQFKEEFIIKKIENNLKTGIEEGLYRKDINTNILARLRVEEVDMGFNPKIFPTSKFDLSNVQMSLLDHFLYGIVTNKGLELILKYKNSTIKN